jgi:hypothetical protein
VTNSEQPGSVEEQPADTTETYAHRKLLSDLAPWAEVLSRTVAGVVVALYACGFLIVSLYHSQYGFVGTNPFRARVLAAGAWFALFIAIPVSIAVKFRTEKWERIARGAYAFWITCVFLSIPLGMLVFDYPTYPASSHPSRWTWLIIVLLVITVLLLQFLSDKKQVPQWIVGILSVGITLFFLWSPISAIITNRRFTYSVVALWFFATTLLVKLEFSVRSGRNLAEHGEWSKPLVLLFFFLLIFSRALYPHLKTSWGGGTPSAVTIYFNKDSLLYPNKAIPAQLIEESDKGFYIVGPKESRAIFVPRSAVALIYFSEKTTDSLLLQNNK